jgi:hypothetical protein
MKLNQLQGAEGGTNRATGEEVASPEGTSTVAATTASVAAGASGKCNTCVISFQTPEEHKAHYR